MRQNRWEEYNKLYDFAQTILYNYNHTNRSRLAIHFIVLVPFL